VREGDTQNELWAVAQQYDGDVIVMSITDRQDLHGSLWIVTEKVMRMPHTGAGSVAARKLGTAR
jgi:hypothetical protein